MSGKHEYWTFQFTNDPHPLAFGPIDMGKPVTRQQILKYIKKKYETSSPVEAWPHEPWWK